MQSTRRPTSRPWLALLLAVSAAVGLALLGAGCARSRAPRARVLRVVTPVEPETLDPARATDGPSIQVIMHVMEGLVQWNARNEVVPAMAQRWDVSPDGRTYTFHLRKDVRFHNGRQVTASDVEFSLNRALADRGSKVASLYLNDIEGAPGVLQGRAQKASGIRVVDPYTLRITIDAPRSYFLAKLTYPTAYVLCREAIEAGGRDWTEAPPGGPTHYIGCGPFRMVEWQHGSRIVLAANDDYFEGRPKVDRLEMPIVGSEATRLLMYENGEAEIVEAEVSDYPRLRTHPVLSKEIVVQQVPVIFYLGLNQSFAPFRDVRVRRAFGHAIDKDKIIKVILAGVGRRADGILPPGIPGFDANLRGLEYDRTRARRLLAEAGFPGGQGFPPLTLSFGRRRADTARVCQVVADMLKTNLGISVSVQELEWATFLKQVRERRFPFYHLNWYADYLDPQDFLSIMLRTGSDNNRTGYSNPEFDRLVDRADVARDLKERIALYRRAERLVVADQPWVPLYFGASIYLIKPYVHGAQISLMGILPHKRTALADPNAPQVGR